MILVVFVLSCYFLGQKSFTGERLSQLPLPEQDKNSANKLNNRSKEKSGVENNFIAKDKTNTPKNTTTTKQTDLDKYLNQKDNSYQWKIIRKIADKTTLVELTSQTWHGMTWKHYMLIVIPPDVAYSDYGLIYIGGGSNGKEPKQSEILQAQLLAIKTKAPVTILFQTPNQPLDPAKKGHDFYEDALIGETLIKAMATKDTSWALLLPMTKGVIRAMDATQEFIRQEYKIDVKKFIIGGASKRGWTTWLVGAAQDARVAGITPIVYNNLNLMRQLKGQIDAWGNFSPRIHDYIDRGLFKKDEIPSPDKLRLMSVIDPYTYLSRVDVPVLLIHGANDPYWLTDATKYYWNEIKGQKYILTFPNVGHNVDAGAGIFKLVDTAAMFTRHIASGKKLPSCEWKLTEKDNQFKVAIETKINATKMTLWTANSISKNFHNAKWEATPFDNNVTIIKKPSSGHIAFFIEIESKYEELQFSLTTEIWQF
jgi:PhoPQ-activated pathogenicity-related protein